MKIFSVGTTLCITDVNELSATTAPALRDNFRAALKPDTAAVEIEMSDTRFLDSSGLGALISIQKSMASRQGSVCVLNPTSTVVKVLELTRLHRVIEVVRR